MTQTWSWLKEKVVCGVWTTVALALAIYGNGEHDLVTLMLFTTHCSGPFILVGLLCWTVNFLLFVYVCVWLQGVRKMDRPLDHVPWAMQLGAASFATAFVSFTLGVWPVFSFLSPVIVVTETYGLIMGLHFLPHFGLLASDHDRPLQTAKTL